MIFIFFATFCCACDFYLSPDGYDEMDSGYYKTLQYAMGATYRGGSKVVGCALAGRYVRIGFDS